MILGGLTELLFGVKAERRRLERIAKPLTAVKRAADRTRRPRQSGGTAQTQSSPV
jgi:hypothetical protein